MKLASCTKALQKIALLALDVDGVLSDGKLYYSDQGDALKAFNVKDGLGIKLLQQNGIRVAIITARQSSATAQRAKELGISLLFQGVKNKLKCLTRLATERQLTFDQIAYVGDDLPDLAPLQQVGVGIAVADAHQQLLEKALAITEKKGGEGAVREVCDAILASQNKLSNLFPA